MFISVYLVMCSLYIRESNGMATRMETYKLCRPTRGNVQREQALYAGQAIRVAGRAETYSPRQRGRSARENVRPGEASYAGADACVHGYHVT